MKCSQCGADNKDGAKFCVRCGSPLQEAQQTNEYSYTQQDAGSSNQQYQNDNQQYQNTSQQYQESQYRQAQPQGYNPQPQTTYYQPVVNESQLPPQYKPIGAWGYFGYTLLFSIPIVGLICAIIFSLGGSGNINLRNYARSQFCWLLIILILVIILGVSGALTFNSVFRGF